MKQMNPYRPISYALAALLVIVLLLWLFSNMLIGKSQAEGNATVPASTTVAETVYLNIMSRKSVRSFTTQPVSRDQLDTLVRAGMAAPTAMNLQPWKFIVVDNAEVKASLAEALTPPALLNTGRPNTVAEAQAVIVVCGDMTVTGGPDNQPSDSWMLDCSAVTENILLMAESMGLGAVWMSAWPHKERMDALRTALKLPDTLLPLNYIPLGYPNGPQTPKDKYDPGKIIFNTPE